MDVAEGWKDITRGSVLNCLLDIDAEESCRRLVMYEQEFSEELWLRDVTGSCM